MLPPPTDAMSLPSGDQASAYTAPKRCSAVRSRALLLVLQTWMSGFLVPRGRRAPSGAHARAYTWLTGSRAGEGAGAAEDWTVLLPHAAKVRPRNTRMLTVETKKDVGCLMRVFPGGMSMLIGHAAVRPSACPVPLR